MKKLILFSLFAAALAAAQPVIAQTQDSITQIYAQLVGNEKAFSSKITVAIDFGQEKKWLTDQRIVDQATGKAKVFNSMVDAMNFMGSLDWEFVQGYALEVGGVHIHHWLLRRYVKINDKGDYIPLTKTEYNEAKKKGN